MIQQCEELTCTREATINYKDLWMLCTKCEHLWSGTIHKKEGCVIHLPHPTTYNKRKRSGQSGEVFMFGPDAM
ncbi:MAG: hypothetical protein QGH83_10845 [Candidatus Pacebacteria bacterium]|jgi:hypothetical protein|nr:hypothetical protein [Candidatus Paceibacterota bacterium]